MEKDSQVKFGCTKCDFCDNPAEQAQGQFVVCKLHAANGIKTAADNTKVLRAAGLQLSDQHS
jgi:hypothetical protein